MPLYNSQSMLQISNIDFEIEKAMLHGSISSLGGLSINWYIDIQAKSVCVEETDWTPYLDSQGSLNLKLDNLALLEKQKLSVPDLDEDGEPIMYLYVFEHCPLREVSLEFGQWSEDKIELVLNAKVDVFFSENYERDLDVRFEGFIHFNGVLVDEATKEKAMNKLSLFLEPSEFNEPEMRKSSGWYFLPKINTP